MGILASCRWVVRNAAIIIFSVVNYTCWTLCYSLCLCACIYVSVYNLNLVLLRNIYSFRNMTTQILFYTSAWVRSHTCLSPVFLETSFLFHFAFPTLFPWFFSYSDLNNYFHTFIFFSLFKWSLYCECVCMISHVHKSKGFYTVPPKVTYYSDSMKHCFYQTTISFIHLF